MSRPAYIIAGRRTPVVPRGGAYAEVPLHELGTIPAAEALADAGLTIGDVDELVVGNALGPGGNPARSISLALGLPNRAAGLTIDRQCASGLDAVLLAQAMIAGGTADVVLAGGVESYSQRKVSGSDATGKVDPYKQAAFTPWPDRDPNMAVAADRLAGLLGISQEEQDQWAVESHSKARAAHSRVREELSLNPQVQIATDPFTRSLTMRHCQRARPVAGTITAANSSVAADGGAFCVVASEDVALRADRTAHRIVGGAGIGGDPELPGLAPIAAIKRVLNNASVLPSDLSVAEIMEAYAIQAIACVRETGIDPVIVNPAGGSLARGHPVGASGAVLAVRLFHEMRSSRQALGIAAIASAGGIGTAILLECQG